jgi:hypothetical protein
MASTKQQQQQQHWVKSWTALVLYAVHWRELRVSAQMSNTMGNTEWLTQQGVLRGNLQIDSERLLDASVIFQLGSSELKAQGGAISGAVSLSRLRLVARHKQLAVEVTVYISALPG